jgi:hypothetical protein
LKKVNLFYIFLFFIGMTNLHSSDFLKPGVGKDVSEEGDQGDSKPDTDPEGSGTSEEDNTPTSPGLEGGGGSTVDVTVHQKAQQVETEASDLDHTSSPDESSSLEQIDEDAARRRHESQDGPNIKDLLQSELDRLTDELTPEEKQVLQQELQNTITTLNDQLKNIKEIVGTRDLNATNFQKVLDVVGNFFGVGDKVSLVKDVTSYENQIKVLQNAGDFLKSATDADYLRVHAKDILKSAGKNATDEVIRNTINSKLADLHTKQINDLSLSRENIQSPGDINFVKYLSGLDVTFAPKDLNNALGYAHEGTDFIDQIKSGTLTKDTGAIADRKEQVKKIQWALYKDAILQDPRGFSSGMLQIEGSVAKPLYEFIDSITGDKTTGSYDRWSSHYEGLKITSKGLDFRNAVGDLDLGELPNGRAHMHYGELPNGNMFIKWEFHGLATPTETLQHMFDFAKTRGLQGIGLKEHVPSFMKEAFKQIIKNNSIDLSDAQQKEIKNQGLVGMKNVLTNTPSAAADFNSLIKLFNYEASAKGNEMVLKL